MFVLLKVPKIDGGFVIHRSSIWALPYEKKEM